MEKENTLFLVFGICIHYTDVRGYEYFNALFLANGVLGVRDLWGNLAVRDSLESVGYLMPRKYVSGAIMDGPFTLLQGTLQPKSTAEATQMVDSLYKKGADFIKVYDDLSKDIYDAIATKCKQLGMPFVGHVPMSISAEYASEMGRKSMEHLNGIWRSCTNKQEAIDSLQQLFKENFLSNNLPAAVNSFTTINGMYSEFYNEAAANEIANTLSKNGTYVTPTLVLIDKHWRRKGGTFLEQKANKYIPENLLTQWNPELSFPEKMFPPATWEAGQELLKTSSKITKIISENGVKLLAGSDCGVSYVTPGFSLHEELNMLVKEGLSNGEALQTATINPAYFFGLADSLGTIAESKYAELVILENNPLDDISNTTSVDAIIKSGKLYNRAQLDSLLSQSAELAGKSEL
ncbi:amidohydrolase family protein [Fulvivirga ligni]|uniref:amidohydrolase family protein n=1 Tax=Fulvivirga ligni TaxID=2904246 RepID=UPI001F46FB74|nr:amidohydrolase family protein [Fulvivirga ligni]UII20312.1 amidohydrolase family protein [Fulvivirga ligni]